MIAGVGPGFTSTSSARSEASDEDAIGGSLYEKIWQGEIFKGEDESEWKFVQGLTYRGIRSRRTEKRRGIEEKGGWV